MDGHALHHNQPLFYEEPLPGARHLIAAGGAAGIAAAFNTALAGVMFTVEKLARSFEHRTNGAIIRP